MVEPYSDLTQDQAEDLRKQIEVRLRQQIRANLTLPAKTRKDLKFRGKAHFADGVLKTWCEDDFTRAWLEQTVQTMASPVEDSSLVVRPQSAIPKKVPCLLFVPGETGDTTELRELLSGQNSNLNMNSWTLTHERIWTDPPGTCLFFRIPETDVDVLRAQERRIYYMMGNIYVRFMDKDGSHQTKTNTKQSEVTKVAEQQTDPKPTTSTVAPVTAAERVVTPTAMEVQDPPSPDFILDEECFPAEGGESEASDSVLYSSPLRED
ncbi:uncharacterized protein LOC131846075 [Achroia grisella]|uniref:uncharacterized protein LOC131846075 n=1 Tax=Achroia grisella TaxID=688607 RepID=UPI0027D28E82|nr:uncharacterized protein LOC131846075 [Achroia grisella]